MLKALERLIYAYIFTMTKREVFAPFEHQDKNQFSLNYGLKFLGYDEILKKKTSQEVGYESK